MKVFYERKDVQISVYNGASLTFPSHLHKEVEFVMCLEGELEVGCNGEAAVLKPYDFMLVFPNTVHSYITCGANKFILSIVSTEYLPLFKDFFLRVPQMPFIKSENTRLFRDYVISLSSEYYKGGNREAMVGFIHLILSAALKELVLLPKKQPEYDDILPELLFFMENNYKNNISLVSIASHFGLNPSYLSRLISARLNCTFTHYLQELRIEYAKHLLNTSKLSITRIAFESGFSTQRTFNRTFSDIVKLSPRDYRTRLRAKT